MRSISHIYLLLLIFFSSFQLVASEPIGHYSKGSLVDSLSIFDRNIGVIKLFRPRGQLFTSSEVLDLLEGLADYSRALDSQTELLQIGDLSSIKGGKIKRHLSHQNGLDVDVVYLRKSKKAQAVSYPEWVTYFVVNGKVSADFDFERNWEILVYLVENYDVGRIFIDKALKKSYCLKKLGKKLSGHTLQRNANVLRFLRPAKYHKTHFHLRLNCPVNSKRCQNQRPPPLGSGCFKGESHSEH